MQNVGTRPQLLMPLPVKSNPMGNGAVTQRLARFRAWYFDPATPEARANAYLGLMAVAYPSTLLAAALGAHHVGVILLWSIGLVDVILHSTRRVRTRRVPLCLPLGGLTIGLTWIMGVLG